MRAAKFLWIFVTPFPGEENNGEQDNHDNDQAKQKLSHRTIHCGMASPLVQARHTRPSTRV
jgi:hypothetical protein